MSKQKVFAGARVRALRAEHNLTQTELAERLSLSTSYVNQIENNQRPLTAAVILSLAESFNLDVTELVADRTDRLLADLREVFADPVFTANGPGLVELKSLSAGSPETARAFLQLYGAYRKAGERLAMVDAALANTPDGGGLSPYEEVRDFFHYAGNYIDSLDRTAEAIASELGDNPDTRLDRLLAHMKARHGIETAMRDTGKDGALRHFDPEAKRLTLNTRLPAPSRFFQAAVQLALTEQSQEISKLAKNAGFKTAQAESICRLGLANYFAGAVQMPYARFHQTAGELAHDLDELTFRFDASLEQVAHRLSTLQRPKLRGVPFFFARVDAAGTITKRHSATSLQFARFGGACPLWNVHQAFAANGQMIRQLAETPDGKRYLCLAWSTKKKDGGYGSPARHYAYALGCEIQHAEKLVYAADLDTSPGAAFEPIGINCRICERRDCVQRAVPPVTAAIEVETDNRRIVPYAII